MNYFKVNIGQLTRRGGINTLHELFVSSEMSESEIRYHFLNQYKGFSVETSSVVNIEAVSKDEKEHEKQPNPPSKIIRKTRRFHGCKLNLTGSEAQELKNISELRTAYLRAENAFKNALGHRYQEIEYISHLDDISISYSYLTVTATQVLKHDFIESTIQEGQEESK